jgi:SAM-dependent methyltransferase
MRNTTLIALLLVLVAFPFGYADSADSPRYQWRKQHDPDGIGKFFMGREIAQVMGPGGMLWLERPEREDEEQPKLLIDALQLKGGETVADLGAGSGYYTFRLADAVGPKGTVLAADIEPKMLSFIKQRAAREQRFNIGLIQSTVDNPRLPSGRVDLVLLVDVYHELSSPIEMMREVRGALKPKGRVALVEYRAEDDRVMIKPLHKMSEAQIVKELTALGFKHLETVHSLPQQHIVIFGK